MQVLEGLLPRYMDVIVQRCVEEVLSTYPDDAAALFRREQDPFANPVGHSVRVGVRGLIEGLMDGADAERLRDSLSEILKIRAVQTFSPSQAVGFVFALKRSAREALDDDLAEPAVQEELARWDGRIDDLALVAFEVYVAQREQVYALRVGEAKRRVEWVVEKLNQRAVGEECE
jgi:RsbT co-antagonist protein rsbRD N-terminal domain